MSQTLRGLAIWTSALVLVAAVMACGGGGDDGADATTAKLGGEDVTTTQQVSLHADAADGGSSLASAGEEDDAGPELPCFTVADPSSVVATLAIEDEADAPVADDATDDEDSALAAEAPSTR